MQECRRAERHLRTRTPELEVKQAVELEVQGGEQRFRGACARKWQLLEAARTPTGSFHCRGEGIGAERPQRVRGRSAVPEQHT